MPENPALEALRAVKNSDANTRKQINACMKEGETYYTRLDQITTIQEIFRNALDNQQKNYTFSNDPQALPLLQKLQISKLTYTHNELSSLSERLDAEAKILPNKANLAFQKASALLSVAEQVLKIGAEMVKSNRKEVETYLSRIRGQ